MLPRKEQVEALFRNEVPVSEKSETLMAKDKIGCVCVEALVHESVRGAHGTFWRPDLFPDDRLGVEESLGLSERKVKDHAQRQRRHDCQISSSAAGHRGGRCSVVSTLRAPRLRTKR